MRYRYTSDTLEVPSCSFSYLPFAMNFWGSSIFWFSWSICLFLADTVLYTILKLSVIAHIPSSTILSALGSFPLVSLGSAWCPIPA